MRTAGIFPGAKKWKSFQSSWMRGGRRCKHTKEYYSACEGQPVTCRHVFEDVESVWLSKNQPIPEQMSLTPLR